MSRLTADAVERVAATCQANLGEIAATFSRALDLTITATLARLGAFAYAARPAEWGGPGVVVTLTVDDMAVVVAIAETSGLLPAWYAQPDATGKSKLATLAQELGTLVLPEDFAPADVRAGRVGHIDQAIEGGALSSTAASIDLMLTADDKQGTAKIVWPVGRPAAIFAAEGQGRTGLSSGAAGPGDKSKPADGTGAATPTFPPYLQSLLQIQVPVSVTLVSKRQPLQRILELGPGSILPFDKLCTEQLSLDVAGQSIAEGEAVKVGDKFGLRLTSLVLPSERLGAVQRRG